MRVGEVDTDSDKMYVYSIQNGSSLFHPPASNIRQKVSCENLINFILKFGTCLKGFQKIFLNNYVRKIKSHVLHCTYVYIYKIPHTKQTAICFIKAKKFP